MTFLSVILHIKENKQNNMDKAELIEDLERKGINLFDTFLYCKFLKCYAQLTIFSAESTKNKIVISDYLMSCIEDFIEYDQSEINKIKSLVYKDYKIYMKNAGYGFVPQELYEKYKNKPGKANQEYFKINNKEEAFKALTFQSASVVQYSNISEEEKNNRYVGYFFTRPWDDEHELEIVLKNRKFSKII